MASIDGSQIDRLVRLLNDVVPFPSPARGLLKDGDVFYVLFDGGKRQNINTVQGTESIAKVVERVKTEYSRLDWEARNTPVNQAAPPPPTHPPAEEKAYDLVEDAKIAQAPEANELAPGSYLHDLDAAVRRLCVLADHQNAVVAGIAKLTFQAVDGELRIMVGRLEKDLDYLESKLG